MFWKRYGWRLALVLGSFLLSLACLAWVLKLGQGEEVAADDVLSAVEPAIEGFGPAARAFALHFVDAYGRSAIEQRAVAAYRSRAEQMRAVVEEFLSGPADGDGLTFSRGTTLRNLFADQTGLVFVDLTKEAARGQPGNASTEYACLAGLVQTLLANFDESIGVQVLIDGEPATTLAGHYSIQRPLMRETWLAQ